MCNFIKCKPEYIFWYHETTSASTPVQSRSSKLLSDCTVDAHNPPSGVRLADDPRHSLSSDYHDYPPSGPIRLITIPRAFLMQIHTERPEKLPVQHCSAPNNARAPLPWQKCLKQCNFSPLCRCACVCPGYFSLRGSPLY